MKTSIKINNEIEIVHRHVNRWGWTEFIPWDIKKNTLYAPKGYRSWTAIRKPNNIINWEHPLDKEEINFLING